MKWIIVVLSLVIFSCNSNQPSIKIDPLMEGYRELRMSHANGFRVYYKDNIAILRVLEPHPGAKDPIDYFLFSDSSDLKGLPLGLIPIGIPVNTIVCTSTSHIPLLSYLGVADKLIGFPNTSYISDSTVRKRIDGGHVLDVGNADQLNPEKVLDLSPDLVMTYSMTDLAMVERLSQYGQTSLINADFMEATPLGRAEWIKVAGLLFDKYEKADSIFSAIESQYLTHIFINSEGPCAFSGNVYGDAWFMPGGKNYAARLLSDAGYSYLWSEDSTSGFLKLSFEMVYNRARDCDFWLSPAPFPNLKALGEADERYKAFKAFQIGNVYAYDKRIGPTGGVEYLEEGYLRPDLILKDLVYIRDSSLIKGYVPYFYRKLK